MAEKSATSPPPESVDTITISLPQALVEHLDRRCAESLRKRSNYIAWLLNRDRQDKDAKRQEAV